MIDDNDDEETTMTSLMERRGDLWTSRLADWFDMPEMFRWFERPGRVDGIIRIEETMHDGALEIRAELPGIDPDDDVDISVADGMLTICAQREERAEHDGERAVSEFRYGSFRRSVSVPRGVTASDITARYTDGILTVTVPMPKEKATTPAKVAVTRG